MIIQESSTLHFQIFTTQYPHNYPPTQYDSLPSQEDAYLTNDIPDDHIAQVSVEFNKYDPYSGYEGKPYSRNDHEFTIGNIDLSHNLDMEQEAPHLEERVSKNPFSQTPVNYDYFEDDYAEI